jgi:RNA polymerase sigma factor (sigma-70 family)
MMDNRVWNSVISHVEALVAPRVCDDLPDGELLQRFLHKKDDATFSAIVRRHGPLVWGVCRQLAANEYDAEDAYQASFLALFRQAHRIRQPNALGAWLHGVAGRICRNGLRSLARRHLHERRAAASEATHPVGTQTWDQWQHAVHHEIDRLPDVLRVPFVLCVLQGMSQVQASERLGWKRTTLTRRIIRAKEKLTSALERRGLSGAAVVTLGGGFFCEPLSARLTEKALIPSLGGSGKSLAPHINQLAHAATGGFMTQMKWLAVTTVTGIALMGAGGNYFGQVDAQSPNPINKPLPSRPDAPPRPPVAPVPSAPKPADTKVQYEFVQFPSNAELQTNFEKVLIEKGQIGWEYAGVSPSGNKLVFKKVQRAFAPSASDAYGTVPMQFGFAPTPMTPYYPAATDYVAPSGPDSLPRSRDPLVPPPSAAPLTPSTIPPPPSNYIPVPPSTNPLPPTAPLNPPIVDNTPTSKIPPLSPTHVDDVRETVPPSKLARPTPIPAPRSNIDPNMATRSVPTGPSDQPTDRIDRFYDPSIPPLTPGQERIPNVNIPSEAPSKAPSTKRIPSVINLRVGEMMRLRYSQDIEKIYALNPKVVEVTLDSNDPQKVLLKALSKGDSQLDITAEIDGNSQREVFQIKVK